MKKLVLMKYLDEKGISRYRSMLKRDMPDNEIDSRTALMEIEAEEMLYTGEMQGLRSSKNSIGFGPESNKY